MSCILNYQLSISDLIAIAAFVVSLISAFFAYGALLESKKANSISLLPERIKIHDEFGQLRAHMTAQGRTPLISEVRKFSFSALHAKAYFPKEISAELESYYNACYWLATYNIPDEQKTNEQKEIIKSSSLIERELTMSLNKKIEEFIQNKKA